MKHIRSNTPEALAFRANRSEELGSEPLPGDDERKVTAFYVWDTYDMGDGYAPTDDATAELIGLTIIGDAPGDRAEVLDRDQAIDRFGLAWVEDREERMTERMDK